jgi:hypothetical protein
LQLRILNYFSNPIGLFLLDQSQIRKMKSVTHCFFVILCFFLLSTEAGLIITGDNDSGFSMIKNDRVLHNFTEMHPERVGHLNFTKISIFIMDKGLGGAITSTGDLYTWGSVDPTNTVSMIQKVRTNATVIEVSASEKHLLYLTSDKKVFCFGSNTNGVCGNSLTCTATSPCVYGNGSFNATGIKAGETFSYILTDKGEVYTSGENLSWFSYFNSS